MATDLGMLSLVGTPPMPPSGLQNYKPQGADVEDSQPFFQYSQCTGKKKGLFVCSFLIVGHVTSRIAPTFPSRQIGINYIGHEQGELHGCINDVHNIRQFVMGKWEVMKKTLLTYSLESFGYEMKNIVTLTDDEENPVQRPTRDNIVCFSPWTPFFF